MPGAAGRGDGEQLLETHEFSSGLERMSCSSAELGVAPGDVLNAAELSTLGGFVSWYATLT